MGKFFQDLKYSARTLAKTPGFTFIAVLTLALGIGASTAVFSVVNGILLKPLPYPQTEKIVIPWRLVHTGVSASYDKIPWGRTDFLLLSRDSKIFQEVGAFRGDSFNFTGSGDPALLDGVRVSAGFFPALGVSPLMGRTFTAEEDQPGHEHGVVLSYQFWTDRFYQNRGVLGRALDLNGEPYTVVGVMPPGFAFPRGEEMPGNFNFPREPQVWVPLALPEGARLAGESDLLAIVGRLNPQITISRAQSEMDAFARHEEEQFPKGKGWFNSRVTPLARSVAGDTRWPLLLMLAAVGVVLLIACSNVANLLLARSLGRRRELTVRAALGAVRARLMRQLLTESLLVAAIGGVAGVLLAQAGIYFVQIFGPSDIPRLAEVALDLRVFAFALGITLATGMLFGLAPAFGATRGNLVDSLKEGGHHVVSSGAGPRIRKWLLISEVALALVLVIAAGLLSRTFFSMLSVDAGFNAAHVTTFELSLPSTKYADNDHIVLLYKKVLDKLRAVPAIESAAIVENVPMNGATEGSSIRIPERPVVDEKERLYSRYTIVSPGYFSAIGTSLLRGRDFLESDDADTLPVVIINSAMAKKFWNGNAIGKQVGLASLRFPLMTIVGVVADVKRLSLREQPGPEMYVPFTQKPYPSMLKMQVVLRTAIDPATVTSSARDAIHSVDSELPVARVTTLAALVENSMAQPRFSMLLFGAFGLLSLALASIGMYGVFSYSVAQRIQEIGVRMALGAQRRNIFKMVLRQGMQLAGIGIAIGLLVAVGVARVMASLLSNYLYGVDAYDLLTFSGVSALLILVALLACFVPARRAASVDPNIALRYE